MSGIGLGGRAELVPDPRGASPASPVLPAPASQLLQRGCRLPRGLANLASAGLLFPTSSAAAAAAVARSPRAGSHGSERSVEAGEGASGGSGQNWGPCVPYRGRPGVAERAGDHVLWAGGTPSLLAGVWLDWNFRTVERTRSLDSRGVNDRGQENPPRGAGRRWDGVRRGHLSGEREDVGRREMVGWWRWGRGGGKWERGQRRWEGGGRRQEGAQGGCQQGWQTGGSRALIVGWGLCRADSLQTWVYIAPHSGVTPAPRNRCGVSFWVCFPGASFFWGLLFSCGVIPHLPPRPSLTILMTFLVDS